MLFEKFFKSDDRIFPQEEEDETVLTERQMMVGLLQARVGNLWLLIKINYGIWLR